MARDLFHRRWVTHDWFGLIWGTKSRVRPRHSTIDSGSCITGITSVGCAPLYAHLAFRPRVWAHCMRVHRSGLRRWVLSGVVLSGRYLQFFERCITNTWDLRSLQKTENEANLLLVGHPKAKRFSASGGLCPLTPWPGALPLDPAGSSAPRPPL